jgi:hypothetical protein
MGQDARLRDAHGDMQMTQDEIIELAKDASLAYWHKDLKKWQIPQGVEAFVKLIADHAAAKEREACEKLHDHEDVLAPVGNSAASERYQDGWIAGTQAYHKAIRARGQA